MAVADVLDIPLIQFLGTVVELLLYGVYAVLFAGTVWVLRARRQGPDARTVSPIIDVCSWFIFITLTIHCAGTIYFTYHGFLVLNTNPLGQILFLADAGSPSNLLREAMYGLSALGTEVLLIYRLWIVWGRSWPIIAFPSALVLFNFVGFVVCLHGSDRHASRGLAHVVAHTLEPILFFGEALTNLVCAVLITVRIVRNTRGVSSGARSSQSVKSVLWIIAESAAIYTTLSIVVAIGLITKDPAIYTLMDVIPPIAGITSCLLHVRVGIGMAVDPVRGDTLGPDGTSIPLRVSVVRHARATSDARLDAKEEYHDGFDDRRSAHKVDTEAATLTDRLVR